MEWELELLAVRSHIDLGCFAQTLPATQLARTSVKARAVWQVRSRGLQSGRDWRLKEDPSRLRRLPLLFPQQAYHPAPARVRTLVQPSFLPMATMNINRSASPWRFSDRSKGGCPDLPTLSISVAESNCMIRLATWQNRLPSNNYAPSSVPPSTRQSTRRELALPDSIAYGQALLQARRYC